MLKIRTNNVPRHLINGFELTAKERLEFDWMTDEEIYEGNFIRYKGWTYSTQDFMRTDHAGDLKSWDGYYGDSFFSGVLIKLVDDDSVIMATYFS